MILQQSLLVYFGFNNDFPFSFLCANPIRLGFFIFTYWDRWKTDRLKMLLAKMRSLSWKTRNPDELLLWSSMLNSVLCSYLLVALLRLLPPFSLSVWLRRRHASLIPQLRSVLLLGLLTNSRCTMHVLNDKFLPFRSRVTPIKSAVVHTIVRKRAECTTDFVVLFLKFPLTCYLFLPWKIWWNWMIVS